jgi:NHLM bacteriocin system ABC transporter ATP-binding protein
MPDPVEEVTSIARFGGTMRALRGNQTIALTDPDAAWIIHTGALELITSSFEDGEPNGQTRHLFQAGQHHLVGNLSPTEENPIGLTGISVGHTEIEEITIDQLMRFFLTDPLVTRLVNRWAIRLGQFIVGGLELPVSAEHIAKSTTIEFGRQDIIASADGSCCWGRIKSGEMHVLADSQLPLTAVDDYFMLTPELWMQIVNDDTEVEFWTLDAVDDPEAMASSLTTLHRITALYLRVLGENEAESERQRRVQSDAELKVRSDEAYENLAGVLNPKERFILRETPILTALDVVGKAMDIVIHPPAPSEDMSRVSDPLEAIARASKVRTRMVLLGYEWWTRDTGPLLAYLGEEERVPVALLPVGDTYEIVHSERRTREPLTQEILDEICPDAYILYRFLPGKMRGVFDLLKFTAHGRILDMAFVLVMGTLATLLGMVVPRATGTLVDTAIPSADYGLLYQLGLVIFTAGITQVIFTWTQMMATVRASTIAEVSAQAAMWDRLLKFRPTFFRQYSSGDLQSRVNAVSEISRELSGATLRPLVSGVLSILNLLLLWYYSWELAKLAIWIGIGVMLITLFISYFIRQMSHTLHDLEGSFNGMMIQMIGAVGKLRVAGAEHKAFNHWVEKYTAQLELKLGIQRLQDYITVFNNVLLPMCSMLLFWKASNLVLDNEISIGDFIAFNTAFILYINGWSDVSNTLVGVLDAIVKGRRIKPMLDEQPEVADDASDPGRLEGSIAIENLSFRYTEDGPLILDKVSCEINPSEFVAFVGASGSGKSTILRMLLGFETPEYGRVLYDGQDLGSCDVLAVRRQIGTVLQNGRLNAGNIFENIANNSKISHAEAWEAVADAGMTEDVEDMAMGMHTMVAEGGSNLSGGQRQRLLIARALVTRPKIVMFDEATSALDNKTQAQVSAALDRRSVTRIVIAHRLSTIRAADRIFVLDHGRIVQSGNFETLSTQEGIFKDLVSRQMA